MPTFCNPIGTTKRIRAVNQMFALRWRADREAMEAEMYRRSFRRLPSVAGIALVAALVAVSGWGGSLFASAASTPTIGTVHVRKLAIGEVLVTEASRTVYVFSLDAQKTPKCLGTCAKFYPPLLTTHAPTAGKGVLQGLLGVVKTSTGKLQVTYNHWPLYTFVEDKAPGQANAQMRKVFGGEFAAIGAAGHYPFPAASPPPPPSTTTTTTPGYNY
jgi:predicted lipoprotein with Yx(FWY)xxD motif